MKSNKGHSTHSLSEKCYREKYTKGKWVVNGMEGGWYNFQQGGWAWPQ